MKEYQPKQPDTKPDQRLVAGVFEHVRNLDLQARQILSNRNFNRIMGIEPSLELALPDIYQFEYMNVTEQGLCRNAIVYAHSARQEAAAEQVQPHDRMGITQDVDTANHKVFINFSNNPDLDHKDYRVVFSANNKNRQVGDETPRLDAEQKNQALQNVLELTNEDLFLPDKRPPTDRENRLLCEAAVRAGRDLMAAHSIDMDADYNEHSVLFKYGTGMEQYRAVLRAKTTVNMENGIAKETNFSLQIVNIDKIATINFAQKPGYSQSIKFAFNDARAGNRVFQPPDSLELKHLAVRTIEQLAANSHKSALDIPREMYGPTSLEHVRIDDIKYLAQALDPRNY